MNVPLSFQESELIAQLLEVVLPIAASCSGGQQVRVLDHARVMEGFRGWVERNAVEGYDVAGLIQRVRELR